MTTTTTKPTREDRDELFAIMLKLSDFLNQGGADAMSHADIDALQSAKRLMRGVILRLDV